MTGLLSIPDPVSVGGRPCFDRLVGQYWDMFFSTNSSSVAANFKKSPSSSLSTLSNCSSLSAINSQHFSTEKSMSIDGYNASTSMLPTIHPVRSSFSLQIFILCRRSSVLSHVSGEDCVSGFKICERKWEICLLHDTTAPQTGLVGGPKVRSLKLVWSFLSP